MRVTFLSGTSVSRSRKQRRFCTWAKLYKNEKCMQKQRYTLGKSGPKTKQGNLFLNLAFICNSITQVNMIRCHWVR